MPMVMYDAVEPLADGCPWAELNHALGKPNLKWCEATQCSWITEPANTWSNLAYFGVALLLYMGTRKDTRPVVRLLPIIIALIGGFSFVYHASSTYFFQIFDFLGMYLLLFLLLVTNLVRRGSLPPRHAWSAYLGLVATAVACVFVGRALRLPYQLLIAVFAVAVIASEFIVGKNARPKSYLTFGVAIALLLVAQGFSVVDAQRLWCEPDNHLVQGHALWHLCSAASLFFVGRHYARLQLPDVFGMPARSPGTASART